MRNARYVNIIKVTSVLFIKVAKDFKSVYVGSNLSVLVMAIQQSDGLEKEVVFQSLSPCFDAPVLTSPSG